MKLLASLLLAALSTSATAAQTDFTFYRDPQTPIYGTADGAAFGFPGAALTASSFRFRGDKITKRIISASWIIVWNPSTTGGYTAVRLIKADDGPSNHIEIARVQHNNYTSPKVDVVDMTYQLNYLIDNKQYKQILQQTAGNGANGPLIYASWIEIVWE